MDALSVPAARTAVLVVDLQNDFCDPDGAMGRLGADVGANVEVVRKVVPFLAAARRAGCLIVFVRQIADELTTSPARRARMATMGRTSQTVCASGTWGAELHPALTIEAGDVVIDKTRYSAFVGTPLDLVLRSQGRDHVVVVGTAANVCVDSTARDAYMRDYHVIVPRDLVGHTKGHLADAALENLAIYFADVTTADALRRRIARAAAAATAAPTRVEKRGDTKSPITP